MFEFGVITYFILYLSFHVHNSNFLPPREPPINHHIVAPHEYIATCLVPIMMIMAMGMMMTMMMPMVTMMVIMSTIVVTALATGPAAPTGAAAVVARSPVLSSRVRVRVRILLLLLIVAVLELILDHVRGDGPDGAP